MNPIGGRTIKKAATSSLEAPPADIIMGYFCLSGLQKSDMNVLQVLWLTPRPVPSPPPNACQLYFPALIKAVTLIKGVLANPSLPYAIWLIAIIYSIFAILFGIVVFKHPVSEKKYTSTKED